ncbi:MAG TPA: phosphoenolpyruvate--protein phosphotransferase [Candidatus Eisenbacteria bacterium]|nr:phosphoenolpyruvate--protein phosphotransferase [Candidatus Eisenbacteria bacterium]
MKFRGVPASAGVGVGPVVRLEHEELLVRDAAVPGAQAAAEMERFQQACVAARADLLTIRDKIARELSPNEAAIYDAHLMILDDPELLGAVERDVRERHRNAAAAYRDAMSGYAARLGSVQVEHLRERHADILDVERRVLRHLLGVQPGHTLAPGVPCVLIAHDLAPSEVALLDRELVRGFVTEVGSRSSHGAIVARGRGIPAVVGCRGILQHVREGTQAAVDGFVGTVELDPDEDTRTFFAARRVRIEEESRELLTIQSEPAVTKDGRRVDLGANIELPGEVERALSVGADGVGLFRTEFFYLDRHQLPSEEEQTEAYRRVLEQMQGKPVIFRTMDLGGDKVASYLQLTHETNPFLGHRGIRFALAHPEIFRAQLRAIYRASAHGRARIMFPMVSSQAELRRANALCEQVRDELARARVPHDPEVEIGMMIETPSAVWMADVLARETKFFSIGTNDLTQYTLAMDRDNERLAHLYEPLDPAILRSIRHTVTVGHDGGIWVGVCGEMAGDPRTAVLLLGMGVDELSVACFDLPRVKAAIRNVRCADARRAASEALDQSSADDVKAVLAERIEPMLPKYLLTQGEKP